MTTTDPTTPETTDPTETAILEQLRERGGEFVSWAAIRSRIPESAPGHRETALHRLWRSGRVSAVAVRGSTYVALDDGLGPAPVHLVAA